MRLMKEEMQANEAALTTSHRSVLESMKVDW